MIEGVRVKDLTKHVDERGSFTELLREDWHELTTNDTFVQFNLSYTYPSIVRAWHRHLQGQNDYFTCIDGAVKLCAYDERPSSETNGELDEIILSSERLRVVRVPGYLWHGFKALGTQPVMLLYGVNRLYNYTNSDEERRPWDDPSIVPTSINGRKDDPRVGKPWDWNYPPHK